MLKLPGSIHHAETKEDLFDDLAMILMGKAQDAIKERGVFHLALSGGSTPEPFYTDLIIDPRYRGIPWSETHIWIVDERRVPEGDEKSNIRMIRECLTAHIPNDDEQIHVIRATEDDADTAYEAELRAQFPDAETPILDFVLLGMGTDCHTASLFPHSDALHITDKLIAINAGPNVTPPDRVTMTYPLLNAARHLGVLCTGINKFEALEKVANQMKSGSPDIENLPITGIQPTNGTLTWYVDHAAILGEEVE